MFPRCETFLKNFPDLGPNLLPNAATDAVNRQWVGCFEQLFSTWKKGNRKEFYVACPNFTVLFTKNVDETGWFDFSNIEKANISVATRCLLQANRKDIALPVNLHFIIRATKSLVSVWNIL